jgi:hypothetical protein
MRPDTFEFRWTVSRGRDTYGYNICSLFVNDKKVSACNGGGYDMKGTSLGNYIARAYADRLNALKPEDMEAQSHWERAKYPRQLCEALCWLDGDKPDESKQSLPHDTRTCPHCGAQTRTDFQDGKLVEDGRYFYGLTYHDPNYDPGKAVVSTDCDDRTLGGAPGLTVDEAEKQGKSLGLERYQAFYRASSKVPTERHTVPSIDGACGTSAVERIMKAIGLTLEYVPTRSKKSDVYILRDARVRERRMQ